jgi:uncharacterized membrane protein (UPF0182 family)
VLFHRNIHERVRKVAPFLTYDGDPYLVIVNGRLVWLYDATPPATTTLRPTGDAGAQLPTQ